MGSRRQESYGDTVTAVDFSTTFSNAWFPTPVFTASGCASSGKELAQFFPLKDIGAVVTKSIMNKARLGSAIEVNISCPNVENRGLVFACDPEASRKVIDGVRRTIGGELPIIAKLSPDVTDIVSIAKGVVDAGADGIALINTVLGMVINLSTMRPHLGGKTGGLSGPAIRPIAVRAIYQVHAAIPNIPILGMGGVTSGRDAFEMILAGASAVSVGTASFGNPMAIPHIQEELKTLLEEKGFKQIKDAIGYAHRVDEQHE